jgi:hypothetical protein
MFIIIISKRLKINPDNIATPIASSLGDVITLAILAGVGTFLYIYSNSSTFHAQFYNYNLDKLIIDLLKI